MQRSEEGIFNEVIKHIVTSNNFNDFFIEVSNLIQSGKFVKSDVQKILKDNGISKISNYKNECMDLIIRYVGVLLADQKITKGEVRSVGMLKNIFKIEEGDFLSEKWNEIQELIENQIDVLLQDGKIDFKETLYLLEIQEIFDLSHEQFVDITKHKVDEAIKSGVAPEDIDFSISIE